MIRTRLAKDRGSFEHGWLKTHHSFSFADYYDPAHLGFKTLRVINEDFISPAQGFGTHGHRDMNIITYIVSGTLEHKDSMGTGAQISAGEWQYMSAGSGVEHSEFNPSQTTSVHLFQIWIKPNVHSAKPRYDQLKKSNEDSFWRVVASSEEKVGQIRLDQNAVVTHVKFKAGEVKAYQPKKGASVWIQMVKGSLQVNSTEISAGDGLAIEGEDTLNLNPSGEANEKRPEFILFELF